MNASNEGYSNFDRAIYAVFGASLGLIALAGKGTLLRVATAIAGTTLLLRAAPPRNPSRSDASSARLDDALADTFPASDPPASRFPDVPPSNAEAKWEAHRNATGHTDPAT